MSANNGTGGGGFTIYQDNGTFAAQLTVADATSHDGYLGLANGSGNTRVYARAASPGGYMGLLNAAGSQTITLNAETGTTTSKVVEITGGSDFSEKFDIAGEKDDVQPGMVVCIDPENPGRLIPSRRAYDRTAAGVISGAGGVLPGMLMGQSGTLADGKHPVALTGRVYCLVDADAGGAVRPGDMITTSDTPGHGMKVSDFNRSHGATIGKAMTALKSGKGLVLVLVALQ